MLNCCLDITTSTPDLHRPKDSNGRSSANVS